MKRDSPQGCLLICYLNFVTNALNLKTPNTLSLIQACCLRRTLQRFSRKLHSCSIENEGRFKLQLIMMQLQVRVLQKHLLHLDLRSLLHISTIRSLWPIRSLRCQLPKSLEGEISFHKRGRPIILPNYCFREALKLLLLESHSNLEYHPGYQTSYHHHQEFKI